jgi:hypothetical protein
MQLKQLNVLRRAADHRLDLERRAVREQAEAVTFIETALASLQDEVEAERTGTALGPTTFLLLPEWLDKQRRRRDLLERELAAARALLERRIDQARAVYLEVRSVDHLIDDHRQQVREAKDRRENAFLDFVGERLRRDRLSLAAARSNETGQS